MDDLNVDEFELDLPVSTRKGIPTNYMKKREQPYHPPKTLPKRLLFRMTRTVCIVEDP